MTRRRSALLAVGLCATVALAVASDAIAGGPVSGRLLGTDTTSHTALGGHSDARQGAAHAPAKAGEGATRPAAGSQHASRTDTAPHGRRDTDSEAAVSGTEEAGEQQTVTRHVDYSGADSVTFNYPGATYVKVHFSRLVIRPGDSITVGDRSGRQHYTYRADPRLLTVPGDSPSTQDAPNAKGGTGGFWSMSITGDTAVVRLHKALPGPGLGKLGVDIDKVAHGFTSAQRSTRAHDERLAAGRQPESVCGSDDSADAVCYRTSNPVEYQHAMPVARLLINGTTLCTAWRLTADDRMITNHHCLGTQSDVSNTEVWFNYTCSVCGGSAVATVTKVPGDKLLRTDETLDYTLFSVGNFDAIKQFGYLGLDARVPQAGEQVYIPQHPEGEPTKLAISSDSDPNSTCQIEQAEVDGYAHDSDTAYRCDTAPGSSGSPVISRKTNKVIALHHLGGCPNSGVRIDLVYAQIKSLL